MGQHRYHLDVQMRDARREISLQNSLGPASDVSVCAVQISDAGTSPSNAAIRAEVHGRLEELLKRMDETDREILVLRHMEGVSNGEAAQILGITDSGATRRYGKALLMLKELFAHKEHRLL